MGVIEDLLNSLSGMEAGTHPWVVQAIRGVLGDVNRPGPGLDHVLARLRETGHGADVNAWAAGRTSPPLAAHDLHAALGDAEVRRMAERAGLSVDEFVGTLSQHLPGIVHALCRNGRILG